jgi:hypothetical protein
MWWLRLNYRSDNVVFVVDKVALGQVFSRYFDFPCQLAYQLLCAYHRLLPGAGAVGWVTYRVDSVLPHPTITIRLTVHN